MLHLWQVIFRNISAIIAKLSENDSGKYDLVLSVLRQTMGTTVKENLSEATFTKAHKLISFVKLSLIFNLLDF